MFSGSSPASQMAAAAVAAAYPYTFYTTAASGLYDVGKLNETIKARLVYAGICCDLHWAVASKYWIFTIIFIDAPLQDIR